METKDSPAKLEAVLARLCETAGPLVKTKAVKLPYLVDVVAQHVLGRRITEGTHQTWDYGVVTREIYRLITHGSNLDIVHYACVAAPSTLIRKSRREVNALGAPASSRLVGEAHA